MNKGNNMTDTYMYTSNLCEHNIMRPRRLKISEMGILKYTMLMRKKTKSRARALHIILDIIECQLLQSAVGMTHGLRSDL